MVFLPCIRHSKSTTLSLDNDNADIMCGCHYDVGVAAKAQKLSRGTRYTRKGEDMRGAGCPIRESWNAKVFRIVKKRQKIFRMITSTEVSFKKESTGFTGQNRGILCTWDPDEKLLGILLEVGM